MPHIIVVDDEVDFREMISSHLKRAGYSVTEAQDGTEGLAICLEHKPDLVITDLVMPNKEGLEMIGDLKRELPDIKIIAISGGDRFGPENYLPQASELGVDCTFTKPFAEHDLLEAVKVLIAF